MKRLLACNGTGVDLNLIHWYCRHQKQERESLKEIPSRGRARKLTHKGQHGNPLLIRLYNREKNSFLKEKKKSTTTTATTINYLKFAICYLHSSIAFRKKRALHEHKLPIWKTVTINQYSNLTWPDGLHIFLYLQRCNISTCSFYWIYFLLLQSQLYPVLSLHR